MKHADPQTLASLAALLRRLRAQPSLIERRPGVFYLGSRAYLHFHDDPAGIFADVKFDLTSFTRVRVSTAAERRRFLARVGKSLASAPRGRGTRSPARRA